MREKCNRQNIDLKKGGNLHIDEKYNGGRGGGGCYPKLPVLCVSAPGHRAVKDSREQEHQVSGREG